MLFLPREIEKAMLVQWLFYFGDCSVSCQVGHGGVLHMSGHNFNGARVNVWKGIKYLLQLIY